MGEGESEDRGGPFTRFVGALLAGREPTSQESGELWGALGRVLFMELKRRRLSQEGAPQWLGIYGCLGWWDDKEPSDAFEELRAKAYEHLFVKRLDWYLATVDTGKSIEGAVHTGVRQFLHTLHTDHDPLGARLFEILREAVEKAVAKGALTVTAGTPEISPPTELAVGEVQRERAAAMAETWTEITQKWSDDLLPELVTGQRAERRRVVDEVAERLANLWTVGVTQFRLGDLLVPWRLDVRKRWHALAVPDSEEEAGDHEGRVRFRWRAPAESFVDRLIGEDWVDAMFDCVERRLATSSLQAERRRELECLLRFYRVTLGTGSDPAEPESGDKPLSLRALSALLKIPRGRIREIVTQLTAFFEACREELATRPGGKEVR